MNFSLKNWRERADSFIIICTNKYVFTSFVPKPHLKFWPKFKKPSRYSLTRILLSFGPDLRINKYIAWIGTKYINLLRYNSKIKESIFYLVKLEKKDDNYIFISHWANIIALTTGKSREKIESKIEEFNEKENIEEINKEIILILKEKKKFLRQINIL